MSTPASDIEIAQAATLRPIIELAQDRLGIGAEHLEPYGHDKAKLSFDYIKGSGEPRQRPADSRHRHHPDPGGRGKDDDDSGPR